MSPIVELLYSQSTWWLTGGPEVVEEDPFIVGVTIPTMDNTGVLPTVARTTYAGPTTIIGTNDPDAPLLIQDKDITTKVTWAGGYVRFYNCYFSGGGNETFDTGQIGCWGNYTGRVWADRCTFRPTNTSYYLDAIKGHHFTVTRCQVSRTVDAFGVFSEYGRRVDVYIEGNYIYDLVRYDVDHAHTDGTHNDCVQVQGGEGVWIRGNAFRGFTKYADGSVPAGRYAYVGQVVLTQQNVSYPRIGGVYYMADIHVNNNWIWGSQIGIRPATRGDAARTLYDMECRDNKWMDMGWDWGGSLHYYPVRPTSNVTVNGVSYPTSGGTADAFGNVWDTNTDVLADYRGDPVMVRCDLGG